MADPSLYTYPSPLEGYENLPPLPTDRAADGKSLLNPPADKLLPTYSTFTSPIATDRRGGFDVHVYFLQTNAYQLRYARELWERVRREFPELRIYPLHERPIGPHPVGMLEVNLFSPAQFGAFIPWLLIHRGPLSALVHPNTHEEERDHTQRAIWMGERWPLDLGVLRGP